MDTGPETVRKREESMNGMNLTGVNAVRPAIPTQYLGQRRMMPRRGMLRRGMPQQGMMPQGMMPQGVMPQGMMPQRRLGQR